VSFQVSRVRGGRFTDMPMAKIRGRDTPRGDSILEEEISGGASGICRVRAKQCSVWQIQAVYGSQKSLSIRIMIPAIDDDFGPIREVET
jgi:hypothetical protein